MSSASDVLRVLKKYPLAIVCFLISVGCGVFIFIRGDRSSELTEKEDSLTTRLRVIERNQRNAVDMENQLEQVKTAVADMQSRLFSQEERAVNANFFYGMESAFGVRITSINQQAGGYAFYNKGGIHELKRSSTMVYNLSLSGQLPGILSFVHQLTQMEPFMRVANLQLATENQAAGALKCDLSIIVMSEL